MGRDLVAAKRTVIVSEGVEFELPEGHSATWIGEVEPPPELPEGVHVEPGDRSFVLLTDGVVGGAYRVGGVDEDEERIRVVLTGDFYATGHATGGDIDLPIGYPFPKA